MSIFFHFVNGILCKFGHLPVKKYIILYPQSYFKANKNEYSTSAIWRNLITHIAPLRGSVYVEKQGLKYLVRFFWIDQSQ